MRFGGQMQHTVKLMGSKQLIDKIGIDDIAFYKGIIGCVLNIGNIFEVARIGQGI